MAIKFGVGVPQGWTMDLVDIENPLNKFDAMVRTAKVADEVGFDSIWLFDHFHTVPTPEMETTFECFTSLAALARETQHVHLGQMATCNGYRNPALLAKIGSTIDVASNGRFILGFGAGWYEHEYRAYGYGYPDTKERMARFREATEIIHRMWTEDRPEFTGKYYHINGPINEPKSIQKPHPPLWLAGSGEQVTLKLVAQWGDGCNISNSNPDVVRQKLDVLRQHCDTFKRDFDSIDRSVSLTVHLVSSEANAEAETARMRKGKSMEEFKQNVQVLTPEQMTDKLNVLIAVGANYFIIYFVGIGYDQSQFHTCAREILPHFSRV
jgi:F420-dependent oxidoreductase-like protein